jgi:riboflavin synthase
VLAADLLSHGETNIHAQMSMEASQGLVSCQVSSGKHDAIPSDQTEDASFAHTSEPSMPAGDISSDDVTNSDAQASMVASPGLMPCQVGSGKHNVTPSEQTEDEGPVHSFAPSMDVLSDDVTGSDAQASMEACQGIMPCHMHIGRHDATLSDQTEDAGHAHTSEPSVSAANVSSHDMTSSDAQASMVVSPGLGPCQLSVSNHDVTPSDPTEDASLAHMPEPLIPAADVSSEDMTNSDAEASMVASPSVMLCQVGTGKHDVTPSDQTADVGLVRTSVPSMLAADVLSDDTTNSDAQASMEASQGLVPCQVSSGKHHATPSDQTEDARHDAHLIDQTEHAGLAHTSESSTPATDILSHGETIIDAQARMEASQGLVSCQVSSGKHHTTPCDQTEDEGIIDTSAPSMPAADVSLDDMTNSDAEASMVASPGLVPCQLSVSEHDATLSDQNEDPKLAHTSESLMLTADISSHGESNVDAQASMMVSQDLVSCPLRFGKHHGTASDQTEDVALVHTFAYSNLEALEACTTTDASPPMVADPTDTDGKGRSQVGRASEVESGGGEEGVLTRARRKGLRVGATMVAKKHDAARGWGLGCAHRAKRHSLQGGA